MVQFWSALAARDTRMMAHVLRTHFPTGGTNATYATYIRCHDDIGWAVTDEDAAAVGLTGRLHRAFLSDFYEGVFPGVLRAGRAVPVQPGDGRQADQRDLRLARRARDGRAEGDRAGDRPGGGPHPDGPRDDRELRGDSADLYGRRDRAAERLRLSGTSPSMPMTAAGSTGRGWTGSRSRAPTGEDPAGRLHAGRRHHCAACGTPAIHASNPTEHPRYRRTAVFAFARQAPSGSVVCLFNFTEDWTD